MPDYDFRSLSSYDFEILTRDLLQERLKVRLESFSRGRDGGVDFRFQNRKGNLVVQCKHYDDYDELYRILKRDEAPKVHRICPSRYVLAISTSLTPHRKDALLSLFTPYCRGTGDIYGREDINNLLGQYSAIETKNFKLWLTSEPVLTHVLQAGIWGDAELTIDRIRRRASRYVPNPSLDRARQILDEHHYCIVAGIPGIGKTTLAEILLIDYVDRHGFQAVRIANDLSEIKAVKSPKTRQIFYFDDFLGTRALDKLQKNEDQRLMEFIEEVARTGNWRFVLTTREYILNAAKLRYESFAYPVVPLTPCIVELSDYTRPIRGKILYNHIYFSDLANTYKRALLENRLYEAILSHDNYNPRIIDHMTQAQNAERVGPQKYHDEFMANLDNPARIWDHAFRNQLNDAARHLLLALGSLPDEVLIGDLEVAFNGFYQYRRRKLGFNTSSRDFEHALKELDGNFIRTSMIGSDQVVTFHNPSVGDFIESYLASSPQDVADLIEGSVFFDQLQHLWRGQRGRRFGGISVYADGFVRKLAAHFLAPTCRLIRVSNSQKQITGVTHWDQSYEHRTMLAVEVAVDLGDSGALPVLNKLMAELQRRMENGNAHRGDLVRLLKAINSHPGMKLDQAALSAASELLRHGLEDINEFDSFCDFRDSFPEMVQSDEMDRIRVAFEEFCEAYDASWVDDPDDLRSIADDLERIGGKLEADVRAVCTRLYRGADEWESEKKEDDHEGEEPDEDWRGGYGAPESTDSMFDSLLEELNERSL